MRPTVSLLTFGLLGILTSPGCEDGGEADTSDSVGSAELGSADNDGGDGDGDNDGGDGGGDSDGGDGDGDGDSDVDVCIQACATAADCALGAAGSAYDEDNYACDQGACTYLGCYSDAECDVGQTGSLVCRANPGTLPTCVMACSSSAECGIPGDTSGPFGPDNYACDDGGCRYLGCNTDAECQTLGDYACDESGGTAACIQSCQVPTDCVSDGAEAPFDEDNYGCEAGICTYLGCTSDRECAVFGDYVCQ